MPRAVLGPKRTVIGPARTTTTSNGFKPLPYGLVDRQEQPDGPFGDHALLAWMCNVSWKQLQPDFQGQPLQGSKTRIGTLSTSLTKYRFNPALKTLQVSAGVTTTGVPANLLAGINQGLAANNTIVADGYNGILLDNNNDGVNTQFVVLANNIANGATTIKCTDFMPNFAYGTSTGIYYLTGTAWIDAAVTWAQALSPRWIDLVPFFGNLAPNWAKAIQPATPKFLTDGVTPAYPRFELDGATAGTTGTTGPVWDANYRAAVLDCVKQLGNKYDNVRQIRAVRCSMGGTVFMEPCLRHISKSGNAGSINAEGVSDMQVGGYTQAADVTMLGQYMTDMASAWPTTFISHSFNAFNTITQAYGPFPVTSYTGTPVTVINFTGTAIGTSGWSTSNSAAFIYYYEGMISRTAASPAAGGATITVEAAGINSAALIATAALTGTLFMRICGLSLQVSSINAAAGTITVTTNFDAAAATTIDGNLQGYKFWITDRTGLTSYAVSAATATSATIAAGPNPQPQAGAVCVIVQINSTDELTTNTLMTTFRSILGVRAFIGNNSVAADNLPPIGNPGGTVPYQDITTQGPLIYYQTNADGTMNGTYLGLGLTGTRTIQNCYALGANWVELPKGYIMSQDFTISGMTSAATRNVITVTGTTNWGANNRWAGGAGQYGQVIFPTGNVYYITASNTTTLTVTGAAIVDAATQSSTPLTTALTPGNITSLACTGLMAKATTSGDIVLVVDSATGNSQAFISSGSAINAASITVTSQAISVTFPTATSTIFYCPVATADAGAGGTPVVIGWNNLTPGAAGDFTQRAASSRIVGLGRTLAATRSLAV